MARSCALLAGMLSDEIRHCRLFHAAMPSRQSRPCRIMRLWSLGGFVLGFLTALAGRQSIWICTAAVEATVHRHLSDQLHFLEGRDRGVKAIILDINEEELAHLHTAEGHLPEMNSVQKMLHGTITVLSDLMIWLSTWGDSTRMAKALQEATKE
jgi:ubiquinone biosynthesis monooxygenase Coq7